MFGTHLSLLGKYAKGSASCRRTGKLKRTARPGGAVTIIVVDVRLMALGPTPATQRTDREEGGREASPRSDSRPRRLWAISSRKNSALS